MYVDIKPKYNGSQFVGYDTITEEESVTRSLLNLFLIKQGTVPGKPWLGNPLDSFLFDFVGFFEEKTIKTSFQNVVDKYEPRANILNLKLETHPEFNSLTLYIDFEVVINNNILIKSLKATYASNKITSLHIRDI